MSGDWMPVLVVLGAGLIIGLVIAWRLGARRAAKGEGSGGDDALRLADLERRREELLVRLRESDNEADRRVLEDQAARVLRDIDRLGGGKRPAGRGSPASAESAVAPGVTAPVGATSAPQRSAHARALVTGFAGGAAAAGLVAVLIFLALRDAKPDAAGPGAGMGAAAQGEDGEHPVRPVPAEQAARLETLRQRAEADPNDLLAQKRLALGLLSAEQYFEAFQITEEILAVRPDDPDALYVQGMVRLTMGQDDLALEQLDHVLERFPNHVLALAGRGMVFMRRGDREAAVLVWERALEAAGGSHPDLERLLTMARSGAVPVLGSPASDPAAAGADEVRAGGEAMAGGSGAATGRAGQTPAGGMGSAAAADAYAVRIEVGAGVTAPPGATLFISLREGEQGPPAAVKRVASPAFPLEVALGPADSMLGRPLPAQGTITARLDADGNASTRGETDLAAEGSARQGESLVLVLSGG